MLGGMSGGVLTRMLPAAQRRTVEELTADLDLASGDVGSKRSAFWTMLVLSAVIASAGVLSDSTATVIGAMIIAPLSTPIMGIALGLAKADRRATLSAGWFVLRGLVLVVGIGALFSLVIPTTFDLLSNSQIASRTSPGLLDLVAAVATGFAGAVALARRDVAAVLPGVAIAISLVPPLAVVGVCLGRGAFGLATGALLLFVSNLLALVLAGTLVFATTGYGVASERAGGPSHRRTLVTIGLVFALVALPLAVNTVFTYVVAIYTQRVERAAQGWLDGVDGAVVTDVSYSGSAIEVDVRAPGDLPDPAALVQALDGRVPTGTPVVVVTEVGDRIDAGTVGRD